MFRAVLWKEWREQSAVVVALLVLGGGVLAAIVELGGNSEQPELVQQNIATWLVSRGGIAFFMLVLAAGVSIGGTLFAGEVESGTAGFLATLPTARGRQWRAKVAAGLVLTAGAGAVLIAEGLSTGVLGNGEVAVYTAVTVGLLILAMFGWGTVGSVLARTTLAACGIGLLCAFLAIPLAIVFGATVKHFLWSLMYVREYESDNAAVFLSLALWVFVPLLLSWLLYVSPDWSRESPVPSAEAVGRTLRKPVWTLPPGRRAGFGTFALLWLLFRQWVIPVSILGVVYLGLGLVMLAEPVPMLTAWPVVTLFAGALVGTIGWADEQGRGSFRYWGERRLPATRLGLAKASAGLALTLGLGVLFMLPSLIRAMAAGKEALYAAVPFPLLCVQRTGLSSAFFYTFLWPVYGFAAGHLAGLLFRKTIVAFAVAVLAGGAVAGLWFPSVYAGGLHLWQFAATPLAAVLTARVLMRAWAADHLFGPRAVGFLVAGLVATFGATAAGLAWRVAEVPVIPESDDDLKFAASLPTADQNKAGQDIRAGLTKFEQISRDLKAKESGTWLFPDLSYAGAISSGAKPLYTQQVHEIATRGYPTVRPDLDIWMDEVFAGGWDGPFLKAAGEPLGVVENVRDMDYYWTLPLAQELRSAGTLMIARGLQKQTHGDPAAYPRYLDATLAASRNMRNKSVAVCMMIGVAVEQMALSSVSTWLERLGDRPDLLREVRDILIRHEATNPTDLRQTVLAERTLNRNSVANPARWATGYLKYEMPSADAALHRARADAEVDMVGFAWAVPWERERLNRLVGLGNVEARLGEVAAMSRGGPEFFDERHRGGWLSNFKKQVPYHEASRRAALLMVTLRLFQAEAGKPAKALDELVPKYLATLPIDPFYGLPFHYRLSAGEWIEMEAIEPRYDAAVAGPGADGSGPGLTHGEFNAVAAVAGGVVRYPKPLPGPPSGEEFEGRISPEHGLDILAAAAGGVVQWPLPPLAENFPNIPGLIGEGGSVGEFVAREAVVAPRRRQRVEPGQGVLWSIGPDHTDNDGKTLDERRGPNGPGDLIWVVPLPAKP